MIKVCWRQQASTPFLSVDGYRPKTIEHNLNLCTGKSEAEVTDNKRLRSKYYTVNANYRQTRSIARPFCNSGAALVLYVGLSPSDCFNDLPVMDYSKLIAFGWYCIIFIMIWRLIAWRLVLTTQNLRADGIGRGECGTARSGTPFYLHMTFMALHSDLWWIRLKCWRNTVLRSLILMTYDSHFNIQNAETSFRLGLRLFILRTISWNYTVSQKRVPLLCLQ